MGPCCASYVDRHEPEHQVVLIGGTVIKIIENVRYATDAESSALFQSVCRSAGVPVQQYAHRTNLLCGSTIGPITAAQLGMSVVDVGSAQLSMHSAREMGGSKTFSFLHLLNFLRHLTKSLRIAVINRGGDEKGNVVKSANGPFAFALHNLAYRTVVSPPNANDLDKAIWARTNPITPPCAVHNTSSQGGTRLFGLGVHHRRQIPHCFQPGITSHRCSSIIRSAWGRFGSFLS